MPLDVLIVGAGVCGPALAFLLQGPNTGYNITVVERFATLRAAGQQIDVQSHGVEILRSMGLLDIIKPHCVNEAGLEILDSNGDPMTFFGICPSGERRPSLTTEYEIMRGDMVTVLYEASLKRNAELKKSGYKGELSYEFGKTITELSQNKDSVDATFSDGETRRFYLVIAADGQGSLTRRLAFGEEGGTATFRGSGLPAAYYSIPRIKGEEALAKAFISTGKRVIVTRTSGRPVTQVLLFTMKNAEKLKESYKEPVEKQKVVFSYAFRGAGWQTDRFLSGLKACDDFYAHEVGQIKMEQLYTGRVVLVGDAGYGASPNGMGTTGAFIGTYVLAGELARTGTT